MPTGGRKETIIRLPQPYHGEKPGGTPARCRPGSKYSSRHIRMGVEKVSMYTSENRRAAGVIASLPPPRGAQEQAPHCAKLAVRGLRST